MLNVPVSEIILNEPSIRALIGQGEAASVAQHVGMGEQGQGSGDAVFSQEQVNYIWHSNKRVTQGRFRPLLTRTHTRKFLVNRGRSKAIFDTAKT